MNRSYDSAATSKPTRGLYDGRCGTASGPGTRSPTTGGARRARDAGFGFNEASTPGLESALHLALRVALRDVPTLVLRLFSACESDLDLRTAVFPVEARRDEREAALPNLS